MLPRCTQARPAWAASGLSSCIIAILVSIFSPRLLQSKYEYPKLYRKLYTCIQCQFSENQFVFCVKNALKISWFPVLEYTENHHKFQPRNLLKLVRFLIQKSTENYLKFQPRNTVKISSFSVLEYYSKSSQFQGQKSTENQLVL